VVDGGLIVVDGGFIVVNGGLLVVCLWLMVTFFDFSRVPRPEIGLHVC